MLRSKTTASICRAAGGLTQKRTEPENNSEKCWSPLLLASKNSEIAEMEEFVAALWRCAAVCGEL